ncbi:hypothetical protein SRM1_05338 [Pseudomonas fluorescens]|nr:hypothetical protein SRM1_05338 [Pseudomonas fluorescens]
MERGFGVFADELVQLLIGLHVDTRADFTATVLIQRWLLHDFTGQADAVTELLPVLLGGHVVEQDARVLTRILGLHLDAATARRTHGTHVRLETVLFHTVAAVVVNRYRQEVVLDVRPFEFRTRTDEAAGLELVAGADAGAVEQPLGTDGRLVVPEQRRVQRNRLGARILQVQLKVILQVFTDARQIVYDRDVEAFQQFCRAYAGTLQNLRRGDGAGAQQDFLAGFGFNALFSVANQITHADGTLAFEQDLVGQGVGDDGQGRTLFGDIEVTTGGGSTAAVRRYSAVHRAEAFLLITVQVFGTRVTGLHACFNHRVEQRVVASLWRGHADRAIATVVIVRADVTGFRFAEIRQAVQVIPIFKARQLGPVVVVHRVAADVAHAVDQRRAAEAFAATAFHPATVHVWLWIGFVSPVVATTLQRERQCGRHLRTEVETIIRPACFEQQNGDAFVFSQTGRKCVTCRAGPYDDVVVFCSHKFSWGSYKSQASSCKKKQRAVSSKSGEGGKPKLLLLAA